MKGIGNPPIEGKRRWYLKSRGERRVPIIKQASGITVIALVPGGG